MLGWIDRTLGAVLPPLGAICADIAIKRAIRANDGADTRGEFRGRQQETHSEVIKSGERNEPDAIKSPPTAASSAAPAGPADGESPPKSRPSSRQSQSYPTGHVLPRRRLAELLAQQFERKKIIEGKAASAIFAISLSFTVSFGAFAVLTAKPVQQVFARSPEWVFNLALAAIGFSFVQLLAGGLSVLHALKIRTVYLPDVDDEARWITEEVALEDRKRELVYCIDQNQHVNRRASNYVGAGYSSIRNGLGGTALFLAVLIVCAWQYPDAFAPEKPTAGPQGPQGPAGVQGPRGVDGLNCWDRNQDGICDPSEEDLDGDGICSVGDCRAWVRLPAESSAGEARRASSTGKQNIAPRRGDGAPR